MTRLALIRLTTVAALSAAGLLLLPVTASAHAPAAATPQLIERAHDAGKLSKRQERLLTAYALTRPGRVPAAYRSEAPWDGTVPLMRLRRELEAMPAGAEREELAAAVAGTQCDSSSTASLPNVRNSASFHIEYGTIGAGLDIEDYVTSLETSWSTEMGTFGWPAPPVKPSSPPPGNRYHVRIDESLGTSLYGYVSSVGTHAGLVGDNPNTVWADGDALASCMVLNSDYSTFASPPQAALDSTTAHELTHSIQFGMGATHGGSANGSDGVDDVFVEGAATWMEDEVFDDANDNYNYLWPAFGTSMGWYGASPYAYWITFRGLLERYGTGVPGGGEDVMQAFWERLSQSDQLDMTALNAALEARGTTLADAYHTHAIAVRFSKGCTGAYALPYCFQEGPAYLAAEPLPAIASSIATAEGGTSTGIVQTAYATRYVTLPTGAYSVRLSNAAGSGPPVRGTVVCDTGTALVRSEFPATVAPGESSTLTGFNAAGCQSRVAVVTSATHPDPKPKNPTASASVTLETFPNRTLTVARTGTGTGTVTSAPAGIACGLDCAETYTHGTSVTLTAAPESPSTFGGWTGGGCSGASPTCTVSMTQARAVTAVFNEPDTTPPQTTIATAPADPTSDNTPTFTFSSSEAGSTFTCRVDSGPEAGCTSPHTAAALADGSHTFHVYAVDSSGNADPTPAQRTFTVDTAAPQTTVDDGPGTTTADTTPTLTFSSSETGSSFKCRVDSGVEATCTSPHTTAALGEGGHTFSARAVDAAGNQDLTPAQSAFVVDAQDPVATISGGPTGPTNDTTPTFSFSVPAPSGVTFRCSLGGSEFDCTSPYTPSTALPDGAYAFSVRAIDHDDNPGPLPDTRAFTVDTAPPQSVTPVEPFSQPPAVAQIFTPLPDVLAPSLSGLSLSSASFRSATGARLRFALSEPAAVVLRVERATRGTRAGARCVRARATGRSCTRWLALRGSISHAGVLGRNAVAFRRALAPGSYRFVLVARDPAGNATPPKRIGFRVLRPRPRA